MDKSDKDARALVDGSYAIVTGLLGLDCEHDCPTELHPVYVMAIRVKDDPADETWAIFVRNWGNEGFCSQSQHYLDLFNNTYTLRLPWRGGASAVAVIDSQFKTTANARVSGPTVSYGEEQGVVLSFALPRPEDRGRINGELHLRWTEVNPRVLAEEARSPGRRRRRPRGGGGGRERGEPTRGAARQDDAGAAHEPPGEPPEEGPRPRHDRPAEGGTGPADGARGP